MPEKLIISVSGLRGIVDENLTADIAEDYARAFGCFLNRQKADKNKTLSVCIGRDSRPSGGKFVDALADGLISTGINVIKLGLATTPGVGIMTAHLSCAGGIVVTASHNPAEYNGIKLLLENGMAPPPKKAETIKKLFKNKSFTSVEKNDYGKILENTDTAKIHIQKVLKIIDKNKIAEKKFKVVLDSVNGAGGPVTQILLSELGCRILPLNVKPTGIFAHTPEPVKQNLTELSRKVKKENADIGFAQDPDADRLAVVDENGNYIGEEYTLPLAAKCVLNKTPGRVAANLSTSRMIDDVAKPAGVKVFRTPVGEANVVKAMLENNCVIGGEGNGGVIDLRVAPIRDSLVAISLILQLAADSNKSISQLAARIPEYYMEKIKFKPDYSTTQRILNAAKKAFADAKLNDTDGCRFDFKDAWLHIRGSNTEPVIRVIVEAKDKNTAKKYLRKVSDIRENLQ